MNWLKKLFQRKHREIEFPGIASSDFIYKDKDGVLRNKVDGSLFLSQAPDIKTMFTQTNN